MLSLVHGGSWSTQVFGQSHKLVCPGFHLSITTRRKTRCCPHHCPASSLFATTKQSASLSGRQLPIIVILVHFLW